MACYAGETVATAALAESWHDLVTPWDSVNGRSPLCQLMRMINDRFQAIHQNPVAFPIVGANPADTFFALRDYAGNPSLNPAGEFGSVLNQAIQSTYGLLISFGWVNEGIRWRWEDRAAVVAALNADLSGLAYTLQEDWEPIILALRTALDSLSGSNIVSDPWTPITVTFGIQLLSTTDVVVDNLALDPASVTPAQGAAGPAQWTIDCSASGQQYGDRSETICATAAGGNAEIDGDLWVQFHFDDDWYDPVNEWMRNIGPTFCTTEGISATGWQHKSSQRQTWRVTMTDATPAKIAACAGKTIGWSASIDDNPITGNAQGITATATPASGTVNLTVGGGPYDLVVDSDLDTPVLGATQAPMNVPGIPVKCAVDVTVALSGASFDFCVDANGTYHDDV